MSSSGLTRGSLYGILDLGILEFPRDKKLIGILVFRNSRFRNSRIPRFKAILAKRCCCAKSLRCAGADRTDLHQAVRRILVVLQELSLYVLLV